MLPFILAGLAVAGGCYAAYKMANSDGPQHRPGRESNEHEKQKIRDEARREAQQEAAAECARREREHRAAWQEMEQKLKQMNAKEAEKLRRDAAAQEAERQLEWEHECQQKMKHAEEEALRKEEERLRKDREEYPLPTFLKDHGGIANPNWAVVGHSGQGKSSLVNLLAGQKVAEVGSRETTMEPTPYTIKGFSGKLWDLPGAGTATFPTGTYIQCMGLRYFDFVFVVSAGRWKEHDLAIIGELKRHGVPCFVVRTKVDIDITNELEDNGVEPEVTLGKLRKESQLQDLANVYFITTKEKEAKRHTDLYDNMRLLDALSVEMKHVRLGLSPPEDDCAPPVVFAKMPSVCIAPTKIQSTMPAIPMQLRSPDSITSTSGQQVPSSVRVVSTLARAFKRR